jgi:hypothetical protein
MIDDYLNQDGYRVVRENWELYDALSAATLTLTGTLPTVSFKCAITVTSATGHTDCAGTVTVGSETKTFTTSGQRLTTTNLLTALPVVTTSGLDCNILIEALNSGGANIIDEYQVEIDCRFQNTQKSFMNSTGQWTQSQAIAYVTNSDFSIGDTFSIDDYDYTISQISAHVDLDGDEEFRKLYLTNRAPAPDDRAVWVDDNAVALTRYMTKAEYDTDNDGIADKAEAVRDLDALPVAPTEGEIVAKDGKLYIAVS